MIDTYRNDDYDDGVPPEVKRRMRAEHEVAALSDGRSTSRSLLDFVEIASTSLEVEYRRAVEGYRNAIELDGKWSPPAAAARDKCLAAHAQLHLTRQFADRLAVAIYEST